MKMNKLLVALGLAATVALVGCNKDKAPETGATTGEHLEGAANQAGHDISNTTSEAANDTATAMDNAADATAEAANTAADRAEIGRASCRASVWSTEVYQSYQKTNRLSVMVWTYSKRAR